MARVKYASICATNKLLLMSSVKERSQPVRRGMQCSPVVLRDSSQQSPASQCYSCWCNTISCCRAFEAHNCTTKKDWSDASIPCASRLATHKVSQGPLHNLFCLATDSTALPGLEAIDIRIASMTILSPIGLHKIRETVSSEPRKVPMSIYCGHTLTGTTSTKPSFRQWTAK